VMGNDHRSYHSLKKQNDMRDSRSISGYQHSGIYRLNEIAPPPFVEPS
jgi:hypothetical protein